MKKYRDSDNHIWTENDLRKHYEEISMETNDELFPDSFERFLERATGKNGELELVADDWMIRHLQESVANDIACEEMPYGKCLEVLQKYNWFGTWTAWEINYRPVDIDEVREMVEQELGLW